MTDKELLLAMKKEQFFRLGEIVTKANAAKEKYLGELAAVDENSQNYTAEYIKEQKAKAGNKYIEAKSTLHAQAVTQLEKLQTVLNELQVPLEFTDPTLTNAVSMINDIGPDLGTENIYKINAQFTANQPALKVLQAAYKSAGVKFDGNIESQIYNVDESIENLKKHAMAAFLQDGSVFQFGVAVGKVAKLENVPFPQGEPFPSMKNEPAPINADVIGASARKAAGLTN